MYPNAYYINSRCHTMHDLADKAGKSIHVERGVMVRNRRGGRGHAQSTYICRVQSSVWRLPKYWPPTPSPPSVWVLPLHQRRGVHTRRAVRGWGGGGVNILEDARHWIGLLQYNPSTGAAEGRETPETEGMPRTAHLEPLLFIALWFLQDWSPGKNLVKGVYVWRKKIREMYSLIKYYAKIKYLFVKFSDFLWGLSSMKGLVACGHASTFHKLVLYSCSAINR